MRGLMYASNLERGKETAEFPHAGHASSFGMLPCMPKRIVRIRMHGGVAAHDGMVFSKRQRRTIAHVC